MYEGKGQIRWGFGQEHGSELHVYVLLCVYVYYAVKIITDY